MFTIFGLAALFLAMVGLYAVMSFSVSHRTRELGIRMARRARRPRSADDRGAGSPPDRGGVRATLIDPLVAMRAE